MKFAVIGKNIDYSLSPIIHKANFNSKGIDATYEIINILNITEEIPKLRQYFGFNVTIPYKEEIIKFCSNLSKEAMDVGAVNCIKVVNQQFYGYNTDVYGFYQLLHRNNLIHSNKRLQVLLIGAGGAAKAVYYCMNKYTNYSITVTNRTLEKAYQLTKQVIDLNETKNKLGQFDLIINCTNVGLKDSTLPISLFNLKENATLIDLNYLDTVFIKEGKRLGHQSINGLDMLIYQAAKSFEIWFNEEADIETIKKVLERNKTC